MKIGYLSCECGETLVANRDGVTCEPCGKTGTRVEALFAVAVTVAERGLALEPNSVHTDALGRLAFMYR